jgi:enoyl-CoA hydratase
MSAPIPAPVPADPAPFTHLRLERPNPGVARLVLDNPAQRNAMTDDMTRSWGQAVDRLVADPDVRVVVVTGEGTAFCSGGDPRWIASEPDASVDQLRTRMIAFYRAWLAIRRLEVPTIAAVNGPAVGAGLCLALACDLRYAAAGARFSAPFVRLGMNPGMAATYLLPDVVGEANARELLLTGRTVHADEALRLGLVSRLFADDVFADEVQAVADGIAATAPIASRYTTVAMRGGGHRDLEAAIQWEALAQPVTLATADRQEGVLAAREKRSPRFRGA